MPAEQNSDHRSSSHPTLSSQHVRGLWSNTLRLLLGSGSAQVLRALLAPLIARLFSPLALGVAQTYSAIGKTAAVVATLRYEDAVQLPEDEQDALRQMVIAILFTIFNSFLALAAVLLFRFPIANFLNAPELAGLLFTIPLFIFLRGSFLALREWHMRQTRYRRVASASAIEGALWDLGAAGMGLAGITNPAAITTAQIAGQGAATVLLAYPVLREKPGLRFTWQDLVAGMRAYRKFPLFNIWSKLLDNAALYLPVLLFSAFFSPAVAGQFTLGFNLLQLPFAMIANTAGQVLYQQAPHALRKQILGEHILFLVAVGLKLAIPPVMLFALAGREIVTTLFGSNWLQAGLFVQVLSPWMLFLLLSLMIERVPAVMEKNENILIFQAVNTLTRLVALIMGNAYQDPFLAVVLLGLGGSLVYGANIIWVLSIMHVRIRDLGRVCQSAYIPALPLGLALVLLRIGLPRASIYHPLLLIAASGAVCAGYYAYLLLRDPQIREMFTSLQE